MFTARSISRSSEQQCSWARTLRDDRRGRRVGSVHGSGPTRAETTDRETRESSIERLNTAETSYRDPLDGGVRRRQDGGTWSRVVRDRKLNRLLSSPTRALSSCSSIVAANRRLPRWAYRALTLRRPPTNAKLAQRSFRLAPTEVRLNEFANRGHRWSRIAEMHAFKFSDTTPCILVKTQPELGRKAKLGLRRNPQLDCDVASCYCFGGEFDIFMQMFFRPCR